MAIPTRTARPGTFFITTATYNRRRLFQVEANALLMIDTLQHYRREGDYKLHAFVVMPDHIHLLLTPETITLERAMGLIKGGFSRRLASNLPVWQRSFTEHRIRSTEDFTIRRNYIRENPGCTYRSLSLLLRIQPFAVHLNLPTLLRMTVEDRRTLKELPGLRGH